ncbi:MAG: betaine-aldehyde dehydrogenase [Rhodospirillaceae bacterium]|jgi:betaine-aldehyde dehydrogenase|nr:betaine-aldehyde dehydrogenase [Rhodospirillaceae bacterium]
MTDLLETQHLTGGYRQSGRLHGYDGLADFTELKHIYLNAGVVQPAE